MAENDNELEFVLSAQTKMAIRAIQDMAKAWTSVKQTYDQVSQMSTKATKAFKDVTLAAEHLSNTNFNKFESGMKSVANAMDSFGKTLNSDNLKSFRQNMDVTAQSVNSFYNSMKKMQNLSKVENLLDFSNLKNIDTTPLSSLVSELNKLNPTNLDSVYKAINNLAKASKEVTSMNFDIKVPNSAGSQMNAMADTLRKYVETISQFNLNGLTSFSKDISQLPKAMKTIEQINLETAGRNIQELTNYIKSFIATLREGSSEIHDFSQIITGLGKGVNTNNLTKEVKESTKAVRDMGSETDRTNKKLGNMLSFGKIYAWYNQMRHYGRSFLNMLNQSIDFAEIENYFSRAMGNMRNQAMDFQNKLSDMFGLAQPQMMQAQATFKNMLGALGGLSDEMSYQLSERVTEMALDFSSLYNTTIDQAMTKFQAALSKQVKNCPLCMGMHSEFLLIAGSLSPYGYGNQQVSVN